MKGKIKEVYNYLFRDELDMRHKQVNIVLLAMLLVQIPTFVTSAIIGVGVWGLLVRILFFVYIVFSIWYINTKRPQAETALLVLAVVSLLIMFPLMFILNGGINSGMPVWMMVGMISIWLILDGKACYITFAIDILEFCVLVSLEYFFPSVIQYIPSRDGQIADLAISIIFSAVMLGVLLNNLTDRYIRKSEELESAKTEAEKANQAKSDFLARVSHEIRTPINGILGMNEMILKSQVSPKVTHYAENIDSAGQTLLSLINDILDFSKIESGRLELIEGEYNTINLLCDSYNMIAIKAADKGLTLTVENNYDLPSVLYGDEIRIRQIIVNLLNNAVKYTAQGHVTLKVDYTPLEEGRILLRIAVLDTGIGIDRKDIERLYDSFARVNEKKNRTIEGTGLGLAICKQLTELMEGSINVTSELGIGSTFIVEIPQTVIDYEPVGIFTDRDNPNAKRGAVQEEELMAPDAKILVVDDIPLNLEVVQNMLQSSKAYIDTASSGIECLQKTAKMQYDLIFLDHMMPELDGVETFERIRKDRRGLNADTPVIILTANAILGAKQKYMEEGFTDYMTKPVRSADLFRMMKEYLPPELIKSSDKQAGDMMSLLEGSDYYPELDKLNFLDLRVGIENCGGTPERFLEIIRGVLEKSLLESINGCYVNNDWKNYHIQIHGTKSTLRMIGCNSLSEKAALLEKAVKEENYDYIFDNHNEFIEEYRGLLKKIKEAVGN